MFTQKFTNKYGAKTQIYNGRSYHSKLEAQYAQEFDLRLKAGEIKEVIPQFKIDLTTHGKHICNYYVDFKIIHNDDSIEYVEIKGFETDVWRIKWKMCEAQMNEEEPDSKLTIIKQNSYNFFKSKNRR